jgi:hypothetical protein
MGLSTYQVDYIIIPLCSSVLLIIIVDTSKSFILESFLTVDKSVLVESIP